MNASGPKINAIHHAQITIPCGQESPARDFYVGLLELPEIEKPESLRGRGRFWLSVAGQELHVGTEDGVDRRATKAHLAYLVSGLDGWRARLGEAGIAVIESVEISGYRRFEFRDPFGNRVEMIEAEAG